MTTLLDLASRVEVAESADRELFEAAYIALFGDDWASVDTRHGVRFGRLLEVHAWLDAAMTLVPEGMRVSGLRERPPASIWERSIWGARLCNRSLPLVPPDRQTVAEARIAFFALVAACLRARAADTPVCDDRVLGVGK